MDKAVVFIDGAHLHKVLERRFRNAKVDMLALSEHAVGDAERLRTYYYHCMPYLGESPTPEDRRRYENMETFISNLRRLPRFEVRLGKLSVFGEEYVQKRVDVQLSVDMVRMSWGGQIQMAVLISGDSDFVPAVLAAKDAGVIVRIYYVPGSCHEELLDACDERIEISSSLINSIRLSKRRTGTSGPRRKQRD